MTQLTRAVQQMLDKHEIHETLVRYAHSVDRGDWALLRSVYHPDAFDDHVDYRGDLEGLIEWLAERFSKLDNSIHFLGNSFIEFIHDEQALVETYFASRRLVNHQSSPVHAGQQCRQAWGRYIDQFEKRQGQWRIARRTVLIDAKFTTEVETSAVPTQNQGRRDNADGWFTELLNTQHDHG